MEKNEKYYIVIQNRPYRHEYDNDDYHIEKVFSKEEIVKIIKDEVHDSFDHRYFIIVTNDETFLNKYLYTINVDELKMLCEISGYNKKNIRINHNFYYEFDKEVFLYFQKILDNEIISATMIWTSETVYPYDDSSIGVSNESFEEWVENKEFLYFKTPSRYRENFNQDTVFRFKDYKKGNIETFKEMVNINILEIGTNSQPNINWEWRNGLLRYYDKISSRRLYIHENLLKSLKEDNNINFNIQTKLDKNLYIEYYVIGIDFPEEYDDDDSDFRSNNENEYSYDKYNRAYGFDDDTIDSAFEGDPENYWNID